MTKAMRKPRCSSTAPPREGDEHRGVAARAFRSRRPRRQRAHVEADPAARPCAGGRAINQSDVPAARKTLSSARWHARCSVEDPPGPGCCRGGGERLLHERTGTPARSLTVPASARSPTTPAMAQVNGTMSAARTASARRRVVGEIDRAGARRTASLPRVPAARQLLLGLSAQRPAPTDAARRPPRQAVAERSCTAPRRERPHHHRRDEEDRVQILPAPPRVPRLRSTTSAEEETCASSRAVDEQDPGGERDQRTQVAPHVAAREVHRTTAAPPPGDGVPRFDRVLIAEASPDGSTVPSSPPKFGFGFIIGERSASALPSCPELDVLQL